MEHDFISLVGLYSLPLNHFPYRCDITTTIHNEETWNDCLESMKAGTTIMDILAANHDVDETTCRFINCQGPDGLYFDKKENKVY